MALNAGSRIGSHVVTGPLGRGGMGEIYRARDTKLDRDVAIKVLPAEFAASPERVARFEREAKTLASLNHPNIAPIHGVEDGDGTTALVLELVEGPTLADRIARGPIPITEALPIATQIVGAVEAAHESGVIHRDLKPANIKIRPDGTVKVLDFGLAKAMEPASGMRPSAGHVQSMSPTITAPEMTHAGMILGTPAYMSPEQTRGQVVDRRADVWAFGCVLYEMLTGRAAFLGDTTADLYLPTKGSRPYQTVLYWPAFAATVLDSIDGYPVLLDFILKSGRAVAVPIFNGTFERRYLGGLPPLTTTAGRDLLIEMVKDGRRAIDYLQTREDIDGSKIALFGYSWGVTGSAILMATEPTRIKVGVLYAGGAAPRAGLPPAVDVYTFLPRIKGPVMMLNGKLDTIVHWESSVLPFFAALGASGERKRLVPTDTGHSVPPNTLRTETLDWLDKYLGPV